MMNRTGVVLAAAGKRWAAFHRISPRPAQWHTLSMEPTRRAYTTRAPVLSIMARVQRRKQQPQEAQERTERERVLGADTTPPSTTTAAQSTDETDTVRKALMGSPELVDYRSASVQQLLGSKGMVHTLQATVPLLLTADSKEREHVKWIARQKAYHPDTFEKVESTVLGSALYSREFRTKLTQLVELDAHIRSILAGTAVAPEQEMLRARAGITDEDVATVNIDRLLDRIRLQGDAAFAVDSSSTSAELVEMREAAVGRKVCRLKELFLHSVLGEMDAFLVKKGLSTDVPVWDDILRALTVAGELDTLHRMLFIRSTATAAPTPTSVRAVALCVASQLFSASVTPTAPERVRQLYEDALTVVDFATWCSSEVTRRAVLRTICGAVFSSSYGIIHSMWAPSMHAHYPYALNATQHFVRSPAHQSPTERDNYVPPGARVVQRVDESGQVRVSVDAPLEPLDEQLIHILSLCRVPAVGEMWYRLCMANATRTPQLYSSLITVLKTSSTIALQQQNLHQLPAEVVTLPGPLEGLTAEQARQMVASWPTVVVRAMEEHEMRPTLPSVISMVDWVGKSAQMDSMKPLWAALQDVKAPVNASVFNAIMHYYVQRQDMHAAASVLDSMSNAGVSPSTYTYGTLIAGFAAMGMYPQMKTIYDRMISRDTEPSPLVNSLMINAAALTNSMEWFDETVYLMLDKGYKVERGAYVESMRAASRRAFHELYARMDTMLDALTEDDV